MKKILFLITVLCYTIFVYAKSDEIEDIQYRRSSIYSLLINHTEQKFANEIRDQFLLSPVPDKYNDHDLNLKVLKVSKRGKYNELIQNFIDENNIGSQLVEKWFDRNTLTGECSMDLIKSRGLYNASELDKELAARSPRGMAMLQDAGEELIGNTFLLANEIIYLDKSQVSQGFGAALRVLGAVAQIVTGIDGVSDMADNVGSMAESIKGFRVKIHTRLYQLVWDEETANTFYNSYYTQMPDYEKKKAFEENRGMFKMQYVGEVISKGATTSFMGINEDQPLLMVRKACQRAIDENVADLQKKHEPFRIKAPIVSVEPTITVQIGLKEGITKKSKFEVLEAQEKDGRTVYKRVGVIKPVENQIWDNRFMAVEEGAYGADFNATTFKKVSGGKLYPGLLVRQID